MPETVNRSIVTASNEDAVTAVEGAEGHSKSFALRLNDGIHVDPRDDHTEYEKRSVSVGTPHRVQQGLPKLAQVQVLAAQAGFDASASPSVEKSSN